jgi:hypothetical protein
VGTVRAECLDWTLIIGRRHLERVLVPGAPYRFFGRSEMLCIEA